MFEKLIHPSSTVIKSFRPFSLCIFQTASKPTLVSTTNDITFTLGQLFIVPSQNPQETSHH